MEPLIRTVLIVAGLVLPGAGWALAARWPQPWLAGGIVSALAIFGLVLLHNALGLPIAAVTLGGGLLLVGLPGWWLWWSSRSACARAPGMRSEPEPEKVPWLLALPVLPLVLVAVWRALAQPLSGPDTGFRWSLLAELMVEFGHLRFYPATSSADFMLYFWADGIAPLVSSLYAWAFLVAESTEPVWSAPVVLAQIVALLAVIRLLGQHWGGARGGAFALALAGGTMLLQFSVNLGQETGLTALGAGVMVYYLLAWRNAPRFSGLIPAAAGAALAACAREYGLVAMLAGTGG